MNLTGQERLLRPENMLKSTISEESEFRDVSSKDGRYSQCNHRGAV